MAPDVADFGDPQMVRVRRYQEILTDFGRMAPDTSDVSRLLQLARVQAARGIGIAHSKILHYRPESGDLLIVTGVGWKPGVVGQASLGSNLASPPGRALQTRQSVVIDDVPNDPEFRYASLLRDRLGPEHADLRRWQRLGCARSGQRSASILRTG
jgi:hypothetical protein